MPYVCTVCGLLPCIFFILIHYKTVSGTVSEERSGNSVSLAGQINGNAFSGTQDGVTMRGNFYGPQASELGGVFQGKTTINNNRDTSVMGSFGASKQ